MPDTAEILKAVADDNAAWFDRITAKMGLSDAERAAAWSLAEQMMAASTQAVIQVRAQGLIERAEAVRQVAHATALRLIHTAAEARAKAEQR